MKRPILKLDGLLVRDQMTMVVFVGDGDLWGLVVVVATMRGDDDGLPAPLIAASQRGVTVVACPVPAVIQPAKPMGTWLHRWDQQPEIGPLVCSSSTARFFFRPRSQQNAHAKSS